MNKLEQKRRAKAMMGDYTPEDLHYYRVDRHSFTIYVGGDPELLGEEGEEPGVEHRMADRFEINLGLLSAIDPERPILVVTSSCGGNWQEGMQMFSAMLYCQNPVTVLGTKHCRSMTSIIPLSADRFVIRPPAQYMYHRGSWGFIGLDQEADTADIERRKTTEMMLRIYAGRLRERFPGRTEAQIRQALTRQMEQKIDVYLSAEEAVDRGFVDAVFTGDYSILRAKKRNEARRRIMMDAVSRPVSVSVAVS